MTRPTLAVGPEAPEFGSWNWIGADLLDGPIAQSWSVSSFADPNHPPTADVIVFLKFLPSSERLRELRWCSRLVFMPVDIYGSTSEICNDRDRIRACDLILVHSSRLSRYFAGNTRVEYIDHPLKYVSKCPVCPAVNGDLLWIGRRCNVGPIVEWCRQFDFDRRLRILTNTDGRNLSSRELGFPTHCDVSVETWCAEKHVEALGSAWCALDIKGNDFRSRHKPPAKALDFLASGLPVIVSRGSSTDLHLQTLGLVPQELTKKKNTAQKFFQYVPTQDLTDGLRHDLSAFSIAKRTDQLLQSLCN